MLLSTTGRAVTVALLVACTGNPADTDTDTDTDQDTDTAAVFDPCADQGPPVRDRDMSGCPDAVEEPVLVHITEPDCPSADFNVHAEWLGLVEPELLQLLAVRTAEEFEVHQPDSSWGGVPVETTELDAFIVMEGPFESGSSSTYSCEGTRWAIARIDESGDLVECALLGDVWDGADVPPDYASCTRWDPAF